MKCPKCKTKIKVLCDIEGCKRIMEWGSHGEPDLCYKHYLDIWKEKKNWWEFWK